MEKARWSGDSSRKVKKWIVVEGDLCLESAAHFGNGETDDLVDMPLLVDPLDGRSPLLTGSSIAGALRSHLRDRECGYGNPEGRSSKVARLFGGIKEDPNGLQSPLTVEEAVGRASAVEVREGVTLNGASCTAEDDRLFTTQVWAAGTIFQLRLELAICETESELELKEALSAALDGLENGTIHLGARKNRGLGRVSIKCWRSRTFDVAGSPEDLVQWLTEGQEPLHDGCAFPSIRQAIGASGSFPDNRCYLTMEAMLALEDAMLIRSASGVDGPDVVHLRARQPNGADEPIISGTSLTGALRHRAAAILSALEPSHDPDPQVARLFGHIASGSRLIVEETLVENGVNDRIQNRNSLDRFTQATRDAVLFNEQPVFARPGETLVNLRITLKEPSGSEVALLLHLLKDLWTRDLSVGGESSVGRGRFNGRRASIKLVSPEEKYDLSLIVHDPVSPRVTMDAPTKEWVEACQEKLITEVANARG
jgi:CRISPR/Cas system CSM-associated protein Csm3 (group 7 of RAMP superfamily)